MEQEPKKVGYKPSEKELEAVEESIRLHNEEIKKKKEKSPKVFFNNSNENDFEKLDKAPKGLISSIYENIKFRFIDRRRASNTDKLYNYQKEKVANMENELEIKKRNIEQMKADFETHDKRMKKMSDQFGGLNKKAEHEALKERGTLQRRLKEAEAEKFKLLLEVVREKKERNKYEEKRKNIINKVESFVNEKTKSYKEKIKVWEEGVLKIDNALKIFQDEIYDSSIQLKKLKDEVVNLESSRDGIFKSEKIMYKSKIKEIEKSIKYTDEIISNVQEEKLDIKSKINKLQSKINYWDNVANESSVSKNTKEEALKQAGSKETKPKDRDVQPETTTQPKERNKKLDKTREWFKTNGMTDEEIDKVINTEFVTNNTEKESNEPDNMPDESIESQKNIERMEISPDEYIEKWNRLFGDRLFGSNLKLDDKKLLKILDMPNGIDKLPLKRIEECIEEYNSNRNFFSRVLKDELNRMFKLIKDAEVV